MYSRIFQPWLSQEHSRKASPRIHSLPGRKELKPSLRWSYHKVPHHSWLLSKKFPPCRTLRRRSPKGPWETVWSICFGWGGKSRRRGEQMKVSIWLSLLIKYDFRWLYWLFNVERSTENPPRGQKQTLCGYSQESRLKQAKSSHLGEIEVSLRRFLWGS